MVVGCGTEAPSQEQTEEEAAEVEIVEETVPTAMEEETVAEEVPNESTEPSSEEGTEPTEEAALGTEEASAAVPVEETLEANYVVITVEGCTDSDGGLNYDLAGSVTDVNGITDEDYCSANENYPGRLYETYCNEDGTHGRETHNCPSGVCELDACVAQTAEDAAMKKTTE